MQRFETGRLCRWPIGSMAIWAICFGVAWVAIACSTTSEIRDRRVLVMDFENTISSENTEELGLSLSEMLTANLSNSPRVAVIERQDRPTHRRSDWRELGARAGVDYVVVGSVSRLEDNYVINARLLSVATGEIVKGSSVTRSCKREEDLYPVVEAVSRVLAHHLKVLAERFDALAYREQSL